MELYNIITKPIEAEFAAFRKMQDDLALNPNPLLREIILHVNKQRGKQMRPMMVMLFGKVFGEVSDTTYNAALALELLHTASLVHDDVVDDSMQRRGQASVNALYNNKLAVLVGDYLLSTALVFTGRCGDPRITDIVGALGQTLADGEIFQMFHSHEKMVSEEVYFEIIRKKTASLFSSCAEIGALSAGAQPDDVARARQIGEYIGICFQIRDDIFDYYSNDVGKPTGNDMREGKLTLPIIYAVRTEGDDRICEMIDRLKAGELSEAEIGELIEFAKAKGGIEYAERTMQEYRKKAIDLLPASIDEDIRNAIIAYMDAVINRSK
ncbi:MAG: polyprenyl synthetase family protein [Bacteroidaceae bacterium]|nr:polyprenyl synthetase family protein [Bacteroidaceae bacterium]